MKRILAMLIVLLWAGIVHAQSTTPNRGLVLPQAAPGTWGESYNNNFIELDISKIPRVTNSNKPANPETNTVVVVTDAATATTCTTGGGSTNNICQWTGSAWVVISGGGGAGGGGGHVVYDETTPLVQRSNLRFVGAGVTATDSAGDTVITIPGVTAGANTVLNNQSNTYTTGDQSFANASSLTFPTATGAAPTLPGRCAYDNSTTPGVYRCGFNGTSLTLATTNLFQPLNTNLTQLGALTPGPNSAIIYNSISSQWNVTTLPSCSGSGQTLQYDATTRTFPCPTITTPGISGTIGNLGKFLTATTMGNSIISESGTVATVAGSLVVGTGFSVGFSPAGLTANRDIALQDVAGTLVPCTTGGGAFTNGHVVKFSVAAGITTCIDGGVAGTGDVTLAGPNTMNNTTLDESAGNVIKITKSVQVELFGPTTDNTSGNGQYYFRVPVSLNGTNLTGIQSNVVTAGTTGLFSVQITKCAAVTTTPLCSGTTVSMLSTVLSLDSGETSSSTAATAAVISATAGVKAVATGDILRFDVTAIHTTPAKGGFVNLDFKLP